MRITNEQTRTNNPRITGSWLYDWGNREIKAAFEKLIEQTKQFNIDHETDN